MYSHELICPFGLQVKNRQIQKKKRFRFHDFSYNYRTEDNKENTFEVSLFAELFNEMLMRDSGFKLYKAICVSAEKSVETLDKSKNDENEKKSEEAKESDEKKTEV